MFYLGHTMIVVAVEATQRGECLILALNSTLQMPFAIDNTLKLQPHSFQPSLNCVHKSDEGSMLSYWQMIQTGANMSQRLMSRILNIRCLLQ